MFRQAQHDGEYRLCLFMLGSLPLQRFREMFRRASLAQHDRKHMVCTIKIPVRLFSVCRGDQWSPAVYHYKQNVFPARHLEQSVEHSLLSFRAFYLLSFRAKSRNLVETNLSHSPRQVFFCYSALPPRWLGRVFFSFPAASFFSCLNFSPRGLSRAAPAIETNRKALQPRRSPLISSCKKVKP